VSVKINEPYVVGEKPSPLTYAFLDSSGVPIDISGFQAKFTYQERFGTAQSVSATVSDGPSGKATYTFTGTEFTTPGRYRAQFWVGNGTNRYASTTIEFDVAASIGPAPGI